MKKKMTLIGSVIICGLIAISLFAFLSYSALAEKGTFNVRIINPEGEPVSEASVYRYFSVRDERKPNSQFKSDENGMVRMAEEEIFRYDDEKKEGILLYALAGEKLAGFLELLPEDAGKQVGLQLEPVCLVHGQLESSALEKLHQSLKWTNVYLLYKDKYPPLSCSSNTGKFEFILPPGQYRLHAYGTSTYSSNKDIQVQPGQKELKVNFDLLADKLATLMGKSAPELREIKGWLNSKPLKLSELRGKVVLLDFWGYWCGPCVAAMPKLVELYEEFSKKGLVIIAIHDDSLSSTEELNEKLREISTKRWSGKVIPFPIALDGGGMSEIEGTDKSTRGATTAAYGIQAWPTCVLIDRNGNVVKRFHPSNKNELTNLLGVKR